MSFMQKEYRDIMILIEYIYVILNNLNNELNNNK